jgi:hypothetical protein
VTGDIPKTYATARAIVWPALLFVELAELGEEREVEGETVYGVWSQGAFFPLGRL